ncbi:MAG TPA: cytochrome c biogenesis protein CcsA [Burkholderiaceae bacterium]|nr:cytochrome c biogenesis protein CcsA [Burkholderiaceae bacterium]HYA76377.1 cytochrome c biogenesis protein CcsA [Burkholderiaceae bacterium]
MQIGAFYGWAHLIVALAYLVVAYRCWVALHRGDDVPPSSLVGLLLAVAVVGHATLLVQDVFGTGGLRFGFSQALSATFVIACGLLWIEGFFVSLVGLYALLTPLAAITLLLPLVFHGVALAAEGSSLALRVHLAVSVLAYSLFTVAALHSVLMTSIDRYLHQPLRDSSGALGPLLSRMPSLLALESLLFRQLAAGFVLLTASLASGIIFSEELFGRPLRFDHKTLFAIIAWCVFAGLLVGRYAFGWRGRVAQRWLFVGFLMLLLAYIGSRFVFEVVLGRVWV